MKVQRKNSIAMVMILGLLGMLISAPTFANDYESSSEIIEETAPATATTYVSDEEEEEAPAATATATSFEEDTSVINSNDSDSDSDF